VLDPDRQCAAIRLRQELDGEPAEAIDLGADKRHLCVAALALRDCGIEADGLHMCAVEDPVLTPARLRDPDQLRPVAQKGNAARKPAAARRPKSGLQGLPHSAAERIVCGMAVADLQDPDRPARLSAIKPFEGGEESPQISRP
jgi:hypothetical protein